MGRIAKKWRYVIPGSDEEREGGLRKLAQIGWEMGGRLWKWRNELVHEIEKDGKTFYITLLVEKVRKWVGVIHGKADKHECSG